MRRARRVFGIALPLLVLGVVAPPAGAAVYGGTSGPSNAFALVTEGRSLAATAVWIDAKCADGTTLSYQGPIDFSRGTPTGQREGEIVIGGNRIRSNGRFTSKGGGPADYGQNTAQLAVTMTGRVTRRSARGTMELSAALTDKATQQPSTTCSSGKINWRARSSPRRVFAGITSLGSPIVAVLRSNGQAVKDLYIGWTADCQPPGQFGLSDALINFRLSPTGRFGDTFDAKFPIEGGAGERTFEYALRGRVRGTRLTGSLAVTVTDRNPDGAVTSTCKRGKHSFTATSTR